MVRVRPSLKTYRRSEMNLRHSLSIRVIGWIAVAAMLALAVLGPSASGTLGSGPGDNGAGQPTGGPRSSVTIGGSLSAAANVATMGNAVLSCDGDSATAVSGSFTLST